MSNQEFIKLNNVKKKMIFHQKKQNLPRVYLFKQIQKEFFTNTQHQQLLLLQMHNMRSTNDLDNLL
jgi:hypothetical protein